MITLTLNHNAPQYADRLENYLERIHARKQGFYSVIDDTDLLDDIENFAHENKDKYSDIVVLGIGGSALGTQTLRDSLTPLYPNKNSPLFSLNSSLLTPKLHIVDNIDPTLVSALTNRLDISTTLFLVVTKSGGTPETLSLYGYFRDLTEKVGLDPTQNFVFITDPEHSYLRDIANAEGFTTFPIPPNVGGRFSVLTAVGLVPAALIGIDIRGLIKGAQLMRDSFLNTNSDQNLPFQLASIQYSFGQQGQTNVVLMPYVQQLKTFADWYQQLLAESTGKIDIHGNNTGLTPMAALGATDQHSQLQQFTQGLNDKQFCVIKQTSFPNDPIIPHMSDNEKTKLLNGISFGTLLNTELQGTIDTLTEENRPNYMIEIDAVDPETLGQLFMLFEGATAFLGEFYEINAFDQPGVERSKVLTREYLYQLSISN